MLFLCPRIQEQGCLPRDRAVVPGFGNIIHIIVSSVGVTAIAIIIIQIFPSK